MKMKNYIVVIFISILSFILIAISGSSLNDTITKISQQDLKDSTKSIDIDTLRKRSNTAFDAGEYLKFDVNYGFVTAGEAILKIKDTVYNNRKCHLVEFTLSSKPFFDVFYKVRDRYSTLIDAEGVFPWRFEQHVREGGYTRDFIAEFDQINHIARTTNGEFKIPPYVHDIMSAFYYSRTIDYSNLKQGQKIRLQNFYKDSTYQLDVKFKGRQETDVNAGIFNCVVIEPLVKEGGLFKSEGRIIVWLSDDDRKIPVLVTAKIVIGSVNAELVGYHGIVGQINSKIK